MEAATGVARLAPAARPGAPPLSAGASVRRGRSLGHFAFVFRDAVSFRFPVADRRPGHLGFIPLRPSPVAGLYFSLRACGRLSDGNPVQDRQVHSAQRCRDKTLGVVPLLDLRFFHRGHSAMSGSLI